MSNVLTRQAGPLKVWQWGAIGGGLGLGFLLLHKKEGTKELSPEEEQALLGALQRPTGSAGGESVPAAPIPGTAGEVGLPGIPGPIGEPGPQGLPGQNVETSPISKTAVAKHVGTAQSPGPGWIKNTEAGSPRNGQYYKVVKKANGLVEHVYKNGAKIIVKKANAPKKRSNRGNHVSHSHRVAPVNHRAPQPLRHRVKPTTVKHSTVSARITPTHVTAPQHQHTVKKSKKIKAKKR